MTTISSDATSTRWAALSDLTVRASRPEVHPDVIYGQIATGMPGWMTDDDGTTSVLPFGRWLGGTASTEQDRHADERLLSLCHGATVDIGCGPGRFVAALHDRGLKSLGVDISSVAVKMTIDRGAFAHHGDVFDPLPSSGEWQHVLLADGNIGICGDPERLLRRMAELLGPGGTVIAELDPHCSGITTTMIRWETPLNVCRWFPWAKVGIEGAPTLARATGLAIDSVHHRGDRPLVVFRRPGSQ